MLLQRFHSMILGSAGLLLLLLAWELVGRSGLAGMTWPALSDVLALLLDPLRQGLFTRAVSATLGTAMQGYAIGFSAGLLFAIVAHLYATLRPGVERFAAFLNAIPPIALGPIFLILLSRDATPVGIATINVFFIIFVAAGSGLRAMSRNHLDLFAVFGASPWQRLLRLDLPAALPALASGLKLAVPGALIGTIIGEWFGASRGLGVLIVNAMQNFQITLLWSAVLLATCISLTLFLLLTLLERYMYRRFH